MAIVQGKGKAAYLDLGNAVEVEDKLTRALDAVQAHGDRLREKEEAGTLLLIASIRNHLVQMETMMAVDSGTFGQPSKPECLSCACQGSS